MPRLGLSIAPALETNSIEALRGFARSGAGTPFVPGMSFRRELSVSWVKRDRRTGGPGSRAARRLRQRSLRIRLTGVGEAPASAVICLTGSSAGGAGPQPFDDPRQHWACIGDAGARSDRRARPRPRSDNAPPICGRSAGRYLRPARRPPVSARPTPAAQSALDQAASDGHSYGCSSGPPRNP